jgi:hypothetical protein
MGCKVRRAHMYAGCSEGKHGYPQVVEENVMYL